jgi:hypothetical protein
VTPPDHDEDHPPFLKRRMGYGTVGGCLGCLTVIVIVIVLMLLGAYFGPGNPFGLVVWATAG